jgi:hypothetical protein
MSIQAAKVELESLTKEQQDDHDTTNLSEEIISNFYRAFIKSTWYSSVLMKLTPSEGSIGSEGETIYAVNDTFHFLIYSYLRFRTPAIRVKPSHKGRVRIAWPHNLGINIVPKACFKADDDDIYQSWDSTWCDYFFQYYQLPGAGKRDNHNRGVGNAKCLEEWTEYLPSYPINIDQPWFYSMDPALSFPIFYKNTQTRARHHYTFRRKISDLLRMQILTKNGTWKDSSKYTEYLIFPNGDSLPTPELWARYGYSRPNELAWFKCMPTRTLFTRDVVVCDAPNPTKFGAVTEISLQSKNPCLAFFWAAENMDATAIHNYSNYTTDTNDLYSGWDPVKATSLKYGTQDLFKDMPSDHFTFGSARKHFPSSPEELVFHAYSYAWDSTNIHGDVGIVFDGQNAKLTCAIADTNFFTDVSYDKKEEEKDEIADGPIVDSTKIAKKAEPVKEQLSLEQTNSPNFITRVRLLVVRKFTITGEKDNFTFSIK